jgi:hypothetical protein
MPFATICAQAVAGLTLARAREELETARKNRLADVGILVVAAGPADREEATAAAGDTAAAATSSASGTAADEKDQAWTSSLSQPAGEDVAAQSTASSLPSSSSSSLSSPSFSASSLSSPLVSTFQRIGNDIIVQWSAYVPHTPPPSSSFLWFGFSTSVSVRLLSERRVSRVSCV